MEQTYHLFKIEKCPTRAVLTCSDRFHNANTYDEVNAPLPC
jgi:hypothetical protein